MDSCHLSFCSVWVLPCSWEHSRPLLQTSHLFPWVKQLSGDVGSRELCQDQKSTFSLVSHCCELLQGQLISQARDRLPSPLSLHSFGSTAHRVQSGTWDSALRLIRILVLSKGERH